jgi:peptidoglycan/xylan/chitin deacetylase (PgdA/CDA1 family)
MLHDVLREGEPLAGSGFTGAGPDRYKIRLPLFDALVARARAAGTTLTFDDGGCSALDVVLPVLEEHGVRGEFHVATARLGTPGFLDRSGVAEIAARGHVVGTHSHTHPARMPALTHPEVLAEWRTSIAILADTTGRPVTHGSVPNGFVSRSVVAAAAEAGIRTLYTSSPTRRRRTWGDMEVVGRFAVLAVDSPAQVLGLAGDEPGARLRQAARWRALAMPKRVLGHRYDGVRTRILESVARRST